MNLTTTRRPEKREERRTIEDWTNETPPALSARPTCTHALIHRPTAVAEERARRKSRSRRRGGSETASFPPSCIIYLHSGRPLRTEELSNGDNHDLVPTYLTEQIAQIDNIRWAGGGREGEGTGQTTTRHNYNADEDEDEEPILHLFPNIYYIL